MSIIVILIILGFIFAVRDANKNNNHKTQQTGGILMALSSLGCIIPIIIFGLAMFGLAYCFLTV